MKFNENQRERIKKALKKFFKTAFTLEKYITGAKPSEIKESLQEILTSKNFNNSFNISCSFGQGNTASTPFIAFTLEQHEPKKGVYPRVAMHRSRDHKIEVSIVESYMNKVNYKAKDKIEKYNKDNYAIAFFIYEQNSCDYEAIINKLEQDINFFLSIIDELEIL